MKRRTFTQGLAAALALPLVTMPGIKPWAQDPMKLKVRLDFSPWGMHAAMHLAQQKGWFNEQGLEVEIKDGTGTTATLQLLAAGQVDVGQVALGTMAVAKSNGLDLISIAGFARTGDLAVMSDRDLNVKVPTDLIGKKLVCFTTSPWTPFIDAFLKTNGMTRSQIDLVMVAPTAMLSTYLSGNSDGFLSQAPFGQPQVAKMRPASALLLSDSGISFPSYGLATTPRNLESKREALAFFSNIQLRAWKYINDGHVDEAVAAILQQRPHARLDGTILKNQIESYAPFFESPTEKGLAIGLQSESDWLAAIHSLEQTGQIKPGQKPSAFYTNELLAS